MKTVSSSPPSAGRERVLVTGGCGFLGRRLVERCLARGTAVTVLDDLSTGVPWRLAPHPALEVVEGSVLDAALVRALGREADRVVHLAAVVGMRNATREPARACRVSVEGTRNVLAATGAAPVVLVSSSAVYGRVHARAARESIRIDEAVALDADGGRAGYATGKLRMERLGLAAARAGRDVLVVRPFNVVGPGQAEAYGAVLPRFVRAALAGEPLRVHDDGRQTRAFSDLDTFLDSLERLEGLGRAGRPALEEPVFNIGCPRPTPVLDLARAVLAATGSASGIEFVPYASDYPGHADVRARVPDTRRLEAAIGRVRWPELSSVVARAVRSATGEALARSA